MTQDQTFELLQLLLRLTKAVEKLAEMAEKEMARG